MDVQWTYMYVCAQLLSCVQLFVTLWTVTPSTPLSMESSRQEYWSGFLFPSPGDLPDPGIEPLSPALEGSSLPLSHLRSPYNGRTKEYKWEEL